MNISQIRSIELDREKPFNHVIRLKDDNSHSLEVIRVNESTEYEQFVHVYKAWVNHKDFTGKEK